MSKKQKYLKELKIESIAFEGISIAKDDGLAVFIKGGVPGDTVIAEVLKKKKNYAEGKIIEIIEPSQNRIKPECEYFGECGGCSWQNIDYKEQVKWKRQFVKDAFERIGKVEYGELCDAIESDKIYRYRNKMEFSFGASRWIPESEIANSEEIENKDFALGLHAPGRFDKTLDITACLLQCPDGDKLIEIFRNAALRFNLKPRNERTNEGFLRNLTIRSSQSSGELMANLITTSPKLDEEKEFIHWLENDLIKEAPYISTLLHSINDTRSPVAIGEEKTIYGSGYLYEDILGVKFRVSPFSFFQTNPHQFNKLIADAIEKADLSGKALWDLYCGAGSITLPASKFAKKAIGIELSESSIADAKFNKELNKIENADFYCADLHKKEIPELLLSLEKPERIIIDPPRAGSHPNLLKIILDMECEKLVYVSCNPTTQARDCAILSEKYDIESLQPVDMFPQTFHVENIALLKLKDLCR